MGEVHQSLTPITCRFFTCNVTCTIFLFDGIFSEGIFNGVLLCLGNELSQCRHSNERTAPSAAVDCSPSSSGSHKALSARASSSSLSVALQPLVEVQTRSNAALTDIQTQLRRLDTRLAAQERMHTEWLPQNRDIFLVAVVLLLQLIVTWFAPR